MSLVVADIDLLREFDVSAVWCFNAKTKQLLNIPDLEDIIHRNEIWTFVKLDRHQEYESERRYIVSTSGRVYDLQNRKLTIQEDAFSTSTGKYKSVRLVFGKTAAKYFVHRLVAMAYIPEVEDKPFVNHIDGIPYHNWIWNLEWVSSSENYIHALRTGLKVNARGENRSNALWSDMEIHMICKMMEDGHKATYIYRLLGDLLKDPKIEYQRVRTLVKHIKHQTHWTHISSQYNIDFSKFNYAKEGKSVQQAIERKK